MSLPTFALRPLALLLAVALVLPSARAQVQLPVLGDAVSETLSPIEERRMGEAFMAQIRPDPAVLDDPLLHAYIESLWRPLLQAARAQGQLSDELWERYAWETFLIRERSVNAFAMPGGFVGVYLGLIGITQQRDELASVMAHELVHITQRHIARRMAGEGQRTALVLLGTILGLLAASRASSIDAANAAIIGSQAAGAQLQLNFSRDMEREADRIGFALMTPAGFDGGGMAKMFERMEQAMHLTDSGQYPYLRSHPLTVERIGEARQRAALQESVAGPSRLLHALMAARARVLMDERQEALQAQAALAQGAPREGDAADALAARYAAALGAYKLRQRVRGDAALAGARAYLPTAADERALAERQFALLRAEGALLAGDGAAGLALMPPPLPGDEASARIDRLLQAQLAALPNAPRAARREALEALQTHTVLQPKDAAAWERLARLYEVEGQALRALRALAESRAAMGDTTGAIDRYRAALRLSRTPEGGGDAIEASVIDARLRALTYARREQLALLYPRGVPPGAE